MKTKWASEKELASVVIENLKKEGWTTYPEILGIDIVAVKDDKIIAVEAKKHFNLKVISQAYKNRNFVNETWIAVTAGWQSLEDMGLIIARKLNIGVMFVSKMSLGTETKYTVNNSFHPESLPFKKSIIELLQPEAQTYAEAGSSGGKQWSNFTLTVSKFKSFIKQNNACTLTEAVRGIKHHYAHDKSAVANLSKLMNQGVIKGIINSNGKLFIEEN